MTTKLLAVLALCVLIAACEPATDVTKPAASPATQSTSTPAPSPSVEAPAPIVSLADDASKAVRLELMLERNESATFSAVVTSSSGEVVYEVREITAQDKDRLHWDVPIERLKPGTFQILLKRVNGESSAVGTYYFRVQ